MSDLAITEVLPSAPTPSESSIVVLEGFGRDRSSEDSISALIDGLGPVQVERGSAAMLRGVNRAGKRLLGRSDAVVVLNPDLSTGVHLRRLARLALKTRVAGKPLALVGVSAYDLDTPVARLLTRVIVKNADLVLLRDEASAEELAAIGIDPPFRIGADPAWAQFDDLHAAPTPEDQVVVALDGVIDLRDGVSTEETLALALRPVTDSGLKVKLHAGSDENESNMKVANGIAKRLGGNVAVIKAPQSMRDARDLYSGSRVVLALQLHALMAAAGGGSRALSLLDDTRAQRLSTTLDFPVVPASAGPDRLAEALMAEVDRTPTNAASVRTQIDRAKASIDLVRFLVSGGASGSAPTADPLPLYPNPWRA